jgi:hypothetical protein
LFNFYVLMIGRWGYIAASLIGTACLMMVIIEKIAYLINNAPYYDTSLSSTHGSGGDMAGKEVHFNLALLSNAFY